MEYTVEELMICTLSREINDGEVIGVGTNSPIPAAASLLAKSLHAIHSNAYILGSDDWPFEGTKGFFDSIQRGEVDVFFLSGGQIDRWGNINLHVIDDYDTPKVRLPGGAGSAMVYFMCKRILLFKTDHTPRGFVNQVDFISSTAQSDERTYRRGQLDGVFTPLGVMRLSAIHSSLYLDAVMPGIKVEEVQKQTGFDLRTEGNVPQIPAPSAEELYTLRTVVKEKLQKIYPEFTKRSVGQVIRI
jgi:glutaconate CoA-transferase subunit B